MPFNNIAGHAALDLGRSPHGTVGSLKHLAKRASHSAHVPALCSNQPNMQQNLGLYAVLNTLPLQIGVNTSKPQPSLLIVMALNLSLPCENLWDSQTSLECQGCTSKTFLQYSNLELVTHCYKPVRAQRTIGAALQCTHGVPNHKPARLQQAHQHSPAMAAITRIKAAIIPSSHLT